MVIYLFIPFFIAQRTTGCIILKKLKENSDVNRPGLLQSSTQH
jgi:hypothetical protein